MKSKFFYSKVVIANMDLQSKSELLSNLKSIIVQNLDHIDSNLIWLLLKDASTEFHRDIKPIVLNRNINQMYLNPLIPQYTRECFSQYNLPYNNQYIKIFTDILEKLLIPIEIDRLVTDKVEDMKNLLNSIPKMNGLWKFVQPYISQNCWWCRAFVIESDMIPCTDERKIPSSFQICDDCFYRSYFENEIQIIRCNTCRNAFELNEILYTVDKQCLCIKCLCLRCWS